MPGQHTEQAFETAIEHHLTTAGGYEKGDRDAFDRERCLFPKDVLAFITATQPAEWEYLENLQKDKAEETLLDDLMQGAQLRARGLPRRPAPRLQMLRQALPRGLLRPRERHEPGHAEALRGQPAHDHAPASATRAATARRSTLRSP